jgi:hypothetical protein
MNGIAIKKFAFDYILVQDDLSRNDKLILGTYVSEADQHQVMHLLLFGSMVPPMTEDMNGDVETVFFYLSEAPGLAVRASLAVGQALEKGGKVAKDVAAYASKASADPKKGIAALQRLAKSWASYKVPVGGFNIGGFKINFSPSMNKDWQAHYVKASGALHAGAALAALAVTVMIFMAAKKAYKATLSKAARACKGYEGHQKKECVRKFHAEAIKKDIQVMQQNRSACEAAKNPGKCMSKVDGRIRKQRAKLQKTLTTKKPQKL